jgi:ribosomal protein S27AE
METDLIISFDPEEFYCRTRILNAIERACFIDVVIKTSANKLTALELFESLNEYTNDVIIYVMDEMCIEVNGFIKTKINIKALPIGAGHYNWDGGKTKDSLKARSNPKYYHFRNNVLKRDNNMCQKCGSIENLHVHHIKSFSKNPDERYNINNGITLCKECHQKLHNFKLYNQWH